MRRILLIIPVASALCFPVHAEPFDIEAGYTDCIGQEPYAIGGAMVGDCFIDRSEVVDAEIETILHQHSKFYCEPDERDRLARSQSIWRDYRDEYCSLIADSPGNTPAYISSGACYLEAAQQRRDVLNILVSHSYTWCSPMELIGAGSQFGPLKDIERSFEGYESPPIAWQVVDRGDRTVIDIAVNTQSTFELDVTGCTYCEDGDCSQGAFLLRYPGPEADLYDVEDAIREDYALLHACQREGGIDLSIVGGLLTEPVLALEQQGWPGFDWFVEDGRMRLIDNNGLEIYWPDPS